MVEPNNPKTNPILPESFLNLFDFEDKSYILNLLDNISKNPQENILQTVKPFLSMYSHLKIRTKIDVFPNNGSPKQEVETLMNLLKIYNSLSLFKEKYFQNTDIDNNFTTDSSLLLNDIFKILSINEGKIDSDKKTELDTFIELFLKQFFDEDNLYIHNYAQFVDLVEGQLKTKHGKNKNKNFIQPNNLNYEHFQKYFKIFLKFFIFAEGFQSIFNSLSKSGKILTVDLSACFNKIIKNLSENNLFYFVAKKFLDLMDNSKTSLKKNEYYNLSIQSLV